MHRNSTQKKITLFLLFLFALGITQAEAQYYRTRASGNWNSSNVWDSSLASSGPWIAITRPPIAGATQINIRATHTITLNVNSIDVKNLIIDAGGRLNNQSFSINIMQDGFFTIAGNYSSNTPTGVNIDKNTIQAKVGTTNQTLTVKSGGVFTTYSLKGFSGPEAQGSFPSVLNTVTNIKLEPESTVNYARVAGFQGPIIGDQEISYDPSKDEYANLVLSGNGRKRAPSNSALRIRGDFRLGNTGVATTASFDHNNGTVILDGTTEQRIENYGSSTSFDFYNLVNQNKTNLFIGRTAFVDGPDGFPVPVPTSAIRIINTLTLTDASKIVVDASDVVLVSDANRIARVAAIPATATIDYSDQGLFLVERYINGHGKAWQLLSVTASGGTINESWQAGGSGNNLGIFITGPSSDPGAGFDAYSKAPSMKYFSTTTQDYVGISSTLTNTFSDHPAYFVFVRGDRRQQNINSNQAFPTVISSKGELYAPSNPPPVQTIPAANAGGSSGGYALIGNPYASSIDYSKLGFTGGQLEDGYYVWNGMLSSSYKNNFYLYGQGGYQKVSYVGGVPVITPGNGPTNYLQSGQGFFVHNTSTTTPATVTFSEAAKVTNAGVNIFRPTTPLAPSPMIRTNLYVNMEDSVQVLIDGTLHIFGDEYSAGVDYLDAQKVANPGENIQLPAKKYPLIVERRPFPVNGDTLFYNISQMANKQYSLQLTLENVANDRQDIYLHDTYQKTETLLHDGENRIDFAINSSAASKAKARFYLTFAQPPLPPIPFAFENEQAVTSGEQIHVSWVGAHQSGVAGYIVEHAADGKTFQPVKQEVASSSENGSYSYSDILPESGSHSYRIKVTFQDGSFAYSKTVSASIAYDAPAITIYPNPVKDMMQLKFYRQTDGKYLISLSNMQGQHVLSKEISHSGFKRIYPVELPNLSSGVYQMEITTPGGFRKTERVVVR